MSRITCLGAFLVSQKVIKRMVSQQIIHSNQTLIFTGATANLHGKANFSAFSANKDLLRMLAQSIAGEFGPKGIHMTHVIIDGVVDGEKVCKRFPNLLESPGDHGALKLDEIAKVYLTLHSHKHGSDTGN